MAGLYIHIPFCESRCIYCDFYSTTYSDDMRGRYVDALCREYELRRKEILHDGESWRTIYLGGGTPSTLSIELLKKIFATLSADMKEQPKEVTIECNPDDITPDYATALAQLPINRVSLGAQTFDDNRLKFIHRRHSAQQITNAVNTLKLAGFNNISIDLMYGFPDETAEDFKKDIEKALALDVPHISAYCLMYEEGTALYKMLEQGKVKEIPEETERAMFEMLVRMLKDAGYEHYEISNFAHKGYRSCHNSSYWDLTPYLGIGAAAHSYDGKKIRSANPPHIIIYIREIENGALPTERETLSHDERYNDYVMLRLRTAKGINLDELERLFGTSLRQQTEKTAEKFLTDGLLERYNTDYIRLSAQGVFVSNMLMSEFMIV